MQSCREVVESLLAARTRVADGSDLPTSTTRTSDTHALGRRPTTIVAIGLDAVLGVVLS